MLEQILERLFGKVHVYVTVGSRPAVEVILDGKKIIIDIKNPVLAIEAGLDQFMASRGEAGMDSRTLQRLKKMGYKIIIKYKMLEFEL